jgi:hypothetical protein
MKPDTIIFILMAIPWVLLFIYVVVKRIKESKI